MRRSPREKSLFLLSILFAAAPFAFGLLRALRTGSDIRMLWMALASFLGAAVVMVFVKARGERSKSVLALSAVVFVIATLLAGLAALLLGATAPAGVWGVAIVFGLFWAASYALDTLSRPPTI
jgi:hypothetical protein